MHDVAWHHKVNCVRSKDAQKQLARTSLRRHFARSFLGRWQDSKEEAKAGTSSVAAATSSSSSWNWRQTKPFELPTVAMRWLVDLDRLACFKFFWSRIWHRSCTVSRGVKFELKGAYALSFCPVNLTNEVFVKIAINRRPFLRGRLFGRARRAIPCEQRPFDLPR